WLYVDKQLKPVRLRLGISDGQNTDLIEGDREQGATVVTKIALDNETRPAATNFPFGQPGRGGFPGGGGFGGPGGGGNRGGGAGGGRGGGRSATRTMSPVMTFRIAFKALSRNKMRTGLTMLGMIIGVSAVITLVAMGN